MAPYTSSELAARIKELPRFPLAHLPTPVEKLANLTRAVVHRSWSRETIDRARSGTRLGSLSSS